ncbi:discoidin domain-containing protein [Algibacter sp. L4_22]|uniref:discoidin domain-containing protein n=1 Tax=Algibacter sp. L4_22 TaxID=2942477 RepID=UPI00201B49CC|nr:discoidin domain-containing protein [Algibacter sp. L4_22]MCL5127347.1 discoidin domain-containing protein [Algibacter sp. L4_22]
MKKITLLFIALMFLAFAQSQNIALSGAAIGSTENQAASNAIDGDLGTRWESATEDPQWISIDLGATYDITQVILNWEGAFGSAYEIQISDDSLFTTYTTVYTEAAGDGGEDNLNVTGSGQYVRMYGTARGTVYGYSLYEFEVYGVIPAGTDARLSDLQVDAATISDFSSGTEDYDYSLPEGTTLVPTITSATPIEGTVVITQAAGIPGDATVVVTATDGTTTKTYTVSFFIAPPTAPTIDAPSPSHLAADVISIYSDAYTGVATDYNPGWGQSGAVNTTYDPTGGGTNFAMAYTNFNYQGTILTPQDASEMEYLHVDIWTANATDVKVTPINNGTGPSEVLVSLPVINGSWSSVDLPIASFTGMTWDSVFQLKFDGQGGVSPSDIYLDNIYFWKAPVVPGTDADLSDLQVDGITISDFSSNTLDYTENVTSEIVIVPTVTVTTNDAGATAVVTPASQIPGTTSIVVTGADGITTKTYTVSFTVDTNTPCDGTSTDAQQGTFSNGGYSYKFETLGNGDVRMTFDLLEAGAVGIVAYAWKEDPFAETAMTVAETVATIDLSGYSIGEDISYAVKFAWADGGFGVTKYFTYTVGDACTLGIESVNITAYSVFPNPTQNSWTIKTKSENISSIKVFDVLGKNVLSVAPNTTEATINGSNLKTGLYFAIIKTVKGTSSLKLLRN